MAKSIVKLFKDPASAGKATKELLSRGYSKDEIGLLLTDKSKMKAIVGSNGIPMAEVELPGVGPTVALGPIATTLAQAKDTVTTLQQALGISPELYLYFEFGLSLGGIMVSVHTQEERQAEARQILREAEADKDKSRPAIWSQSPGFSQSQRMVETNPVDAKLSGDFRRY